MTVAVELRPQSDRKPVDHPDLMMQARSVANRYDISVRTLDRWLLKEHLAFPKPAMVLHDIAGRVSARFWRLGDLIAWERTQAVKSAS